MLESNSAIMSLDLHANAITDAYVSRGKLPQSACESHASL